MKTKLFPAVIFVLAQLAPYGIHAGGLVAAWGNQNNIQFDQWKTTILPEGVVNIKAVAAGFEHAVALKADGTVVAWGYNNEGQTDVPSGLSGVKAVGAGWYYSAALKTDGTVVTWGDNFGTSVPAGISNIVAIAAGQNGDILALKADGTVVAWGYDNYGEDDVPAGLSNVTAVAVGEFHSLALKADGSVAAWGDDSYGQTDVPAGLTHVTAIAAGDFFSVALKEDGTVAAWGYNANGQTNVPAGLSNVVAIAAGSYHVLALQADGSVVAWGDNTYGETNVPAQLSNVTAMAAGGFYSLALVFSGPVQITQNPQSQSVNYTSNATFSVTATGAAPSGYQWFLNGQALTDNSRVSGSTTASLNISNAQFGDIGTYTVVVSNALGSVISSGVAFTVISPPFVTAQSATNLTVGAGTNVTLSVSADGTPPLSYQWLFNGTYLAGATGTALALADVQPAMSGTYSLQITNVYGAIQADFLLTVTDTPPYILTQPMGGLVPVNSSFTFSVSARGSLPLSYQWRFNGQNLSGATNATLTLSNLNGSQSGYYDVAVSNPFGAVVSVKALLSVGQTAVNIWSPYPEPQNPTNVPPGLTNAIALAAGDYHVLALKRDGTVVTWVAPNYAKPGVALTNVPPSVTNVTAISAAGSSSMALRADGTVVVWGDTSFGLTNVPASATNVVAIADGGDHCMALKANGAIVGWGNKSYNQLNPPAGLTNVAAIAAGYTFNLAVRYDSTLVSWGNPAYTNQVPAGLTNLLAVSPDSASVYATTVALRTDGTVTNWGRNQGMPFNLSNVVAVSAGYNVSAALKSDGTVVTWPLSFSSSISNVIAIASGGLQTSFVAVLVGDGSPAITIQPVSQTTTNGATVQFHVRAVGAQTLGDSMKRQQLPEPLSYQWQFNGANLPGATNGDLVLTNVQGFNVGAYQAIVTNVLGAVTSRVAQLTIPYNGTLAAALDATNLVWTTGPTNAAWFPEISVTHDGDAAQSGHITDGQQSILQTTVAGPGLLTFWWKVSSEQYFDFLNFYLDQTNTPLARISGDVDWQQVSFNLPSGPHTLWWIYAKDPSVSVGQDAGWLDQVSFTPAPLITQQPQSQTVWMGSNVTFQASATWGGMAWMQWLKNGTNLPDAHSLSLTLTNLTRRDSGIYALQITNAGGSATSSNALLTVRVPQRLSAPGLLPDGSFGCMSRDADGGTLQPGDLAGFEVQASTNLVDWISLPQALMLTNGILQLHDPSAANAPVRFYRIIENP